MAQQDNYRVGELEEEIPPGVLLCVCCGYDAVSVIVSDQHMCLQCHKTVPNHIHKYQIVKFAKAYRRRKHGNKL
jgi:hypothetical protein